MKAPAFDYLRPDSLDDALSAYASQDQDALYLAGGHSVVPSLALRLQAPSVLIDISRIEELSGIQLVDGWLRIGAMTRHVQALEDPLIARHAPLLRAAAPHVAHPAIRNRGTIGGSVALADPASEFPAVMLAMRAELEITGQGGTRRVPADDFFLDLYETAIEPGEILTAIHVPPQTPGTVVAFDEFARRRGDYALVGAGVQAVLGKGVVNEIGIAFFSVANVPTRAAAAEAALIGRPLDGAAIQAAQAAIAEDIDPPDEPELSASVRLHLARVLLGRLLARVGASA